ncbi:sigma-70 family RNA polymerase sigma factor [Candidatus Saccharibacteria bacterium]|nr:sigma-70 family RNA polymerase sigma factor [Candidatus Saccharibacteria bacterium]
MDVFRLYLKDVGRYNLLTRHEERDLANLYREGREAQTMLERTDGKLPLQEKEKLESAMLRGKEARERLICCNLRLAISEAFKTARSWTWGFRGIGVVDLIQAGNVGLLRAVEKFDPNRGSFANYAIHWVRREIGQLGDGYAKTIRVPVEKRQLARRVLKAQSKLEKLGRPVTLETIAEEARVTTEEVELVRAFPTTVSLDEYLDSEERNSDFYSVIPDPTTVESQAMARILLIQCLVAMTQVLTDRERNILELRVLTPATLEEIGRKEGVTKERVRQIEAEARKKLSAQINTHKAHG